VHPGPRRPRQARPEETVVQAAGREIRVSNPGKVLFAQRGETKLDLVSYYQAVEVPLMRAVGGRPVLLQRFPDGAEGPSFFQKRVPEKRPGWLRTIELTTPNGTKSDALVAHDIAHVIWAVNLACLGFHVWPCLADDPEHADQLRVDLDPGEGVGFDMVREAADEVHQLLEGLGVMAYPKTTGNRGIHVFAALEHRWSALDVRASAVAIARELERRRPDLITASWWKEQRGKRVFVDYNQNAPHKTIFGAWSVRARPGAQVSAPFSWDELATVCPDALTMATVPERIASLGDPWEGIAASPQPLEPLLALHERDRAAGLRDAPWPPVYPKMGDEPPRVAPSRARRAQGKGDVSSP